MSKTVWVISEHRFQCFKHWPVAVLVVEPKLFTFRQVHSVAKSGPKAEVLPLVCVVYCNSGWCIACTQTEKHLGKQPQSKTVFRLPTIPASPPRGRTSPVLWTLAGAVGIAPSLWPAWRAGNIVKCLLSRGKYMCTSGPAAKRSKVW